MMRDPGSLLHFFGAGLRLLTSLRIQALFPPALAEISFHKLRALGPQRILAQKQVNRRLTNKKRLIAAATEMEYSRDLR